MLPDLTQTLELLDFVFPSSFEEQPEPKGHAGEVLACALAVVDKRGDSKSTKPVIRVTSRFFMCSASNFPIQKPVAPSELKNPLHQTSAQNLRSHEVHGRLISNMKQNLTKAPRLL